MALAVTPTGICFWIGLEIFDRNAKDRFVNHGEDCVCDEFAATIEDELGIKRNSTL